MTLWDSFDFKEYLKVDERLFDLPKGVSISTMCGKCKLGSDLDLDNIKHYLTLSTDDILTVKMSKIDMRTLIPTKKKKRRTKKVVPVTNNPFYNQVTVVIRVHEGKFEDLNDEYKINVKLFRNGSIQISGLTNIMYANRALNKLIYCLKQTKARKIDTKIVDIIYAKDIVNLGISDFQIYMINSNYQVNMMIDRNKLFNLLLKKKIKASYEKCIRACVIIKYVPTNDNTEEKEVSIFIFEKGNIIITGARNYHHIVDSYNYVNSILLEHADDIIKKDDTLEGILLLKLYDDIFKENSHKLTNLNLAI
jgi:TATA-box binding protein (TBP) (component of TFIID and TFIIIB)